MHCFNGIKMNTFRIRSSRIVSMHKNDSSHAYGPHSFVKISARHTRIYPRWKKSNPLNHACSPSCMFIAIFRLRFSPSFFLFLRFHMASTRPYALIERIDDHLYWRVCGGISPKKTQTHKSPKWFFPRYLFCFTIFSQIFFASLRGVFRCVFLLRFGKLQVAIENLRAFPKL